MEDHDFSVLQYDAFLLKTDLCISSVEEIQGNSGPGSKANTCTARLLEESPLVCKLHFQNEFLACELAAEAAGKGGGGVLALVPDLISVLESETG